jgi:hypothetical protein
MLLSYEGGGFTKVLPVRESDHDQAIELVAFLQSEWLETDAPEVDRTALIIQKYWEIIEAVTLLIPTVPGLGWKIDKLKQNPDLVQFFFLHPEGSFWKLHEFEVKGETVDRPNCLEDDSDLIPENLPFPTCGNSNADKIASYLHGTEWGPIGIKALFDWCSREEIAGLQFTLDELGNPDRRIEKEKQRIAADIYANVDPALYDTDDENFVWDTDYEM